MSCKVEWGSDIPMDSDTKQLLLVLCVCVGINHSNYNYTLHTYVQCHLNYNSHISSFLLWFWESVCRISIWWMLWSFFIERMEYSGIRRHCLRSPQWIFETKTQICIFVNIYVTCACYLWRYNKFVIHMYLIITWLSSYFDSLIN